MVSKRTEELKALANVMFVVAIVGIVICCAASNEIVGYFGIILVAVGFLLAITFDSLAEMTGGKFIQEEEYITKQTDELRKVEYPFSEFLANNDCTLDELIRLCDEHNLNINYVYDQYQLAAGDDTIQTRRQVQEIMDMERWRMNGAV